MHSMTNRYPILALLSLVLCLGSCQPSSQKIRIGYVQITQDPVLDSAKAGLFRALADSGYVDGQNIKVIDNNAQGDLSMISTILQSFQSQGLDMVITNSTPCMAAAAQQIQNTPVVFTVAFSPEQIGFTEVPDNLHGVYDPFRAAEFIELLQECIPGISRIGIPYNNAEPNAEYAFKRIASECAKRDIKLIAASVTSPNDLMQAGQYLASQQIGALVAAADNTVYLGLPVIQSIAVRNHIPLFVTDPQQVEKGAAAGMGVSYKKWGYQSGLKAVEILKGRTPATRIETIRTYELAINLKACAEQGLSLPESVLAMADRVIR